MTQSEFIKLYCETSNISEKDLNKLGQFAVACDCGQDCCEGWAMVNRFSLIHHINLYIKQFNF